MKKKIINLLLVGILAVGTLTGCETEAELLMLLKI